MKKFSALLFAALLLSGSAAIAQTETVSLQPKKLQQLYVSAGTGPAFTSNDASRPIGGNFQGNITAGFGCGYLFRAGVQKSGFTAAQRPAPELFSYFSEFSYTGNFHSYNESKSVSLSVGKYKKLNKLVQVQAFGGFSLNYIQTFDYISPEMSEYVFCGTPYINSYLKPGLLIQAEAMFLPSRFSGLSLGGYYNLTPLLPNGGISLSLNLGLLK